jgi:hypothetical protein
MALSHIALITSSIFYLILAYLNLFGQETLVNILGLPADVSDQLKHQKGALGGLAVMSMRCLGVAFFILAFIIGHMIKLVDKHGPALRTTTMTTALFTAVYAHRAYLDSTVSAAGAAACKQFAAANGILLVISVAAFSSLPKTPAKQE